MRHGFEVYIRNGFSELVNVGPSTPLDKKMEGGSFSHSSAKNANECTRPARPAAGEVDVED